MKRIESYWSAAMVLALGICLMMAPGAARAQGGNDDTPELSRNWNISIGLFVPQMNAARKKSGDVGFSGYVDRTVYQTTNIDVNVGVGYTGFGDVYAIPIMVFGVAHHFNARYGLGAGYAFGKRIDGRGTSGAALGLLLGYQLTQGKYPSSVDLRYNFIAGSDQELDGYSLTIGMRF